VPNAKPANLNPDTVPVDPTLVLLAQKADGTADYKVAIGDLPLSTPQQNALPTYSIPLAQKAAVNGVASLDANGKIPVTQIPASAFTSVDVVASQAAMLALSGAIEGALAIRTDTGANYVLTNNTPSVLANWALLGTTIVNADNCIDGTTNHVFTAADDTKLAAVEAGSNKGVIVNEWNGSTWVRNTTAVVLWVNRIDATAPTADTEGVDIILLNTGA
jgi:hypothetical protein